MRRCVVVLVSLLAGCSTSRTASRGPGPEPEPAPAAGAGAASAQVVSAPPEARRIPTPLLAGARVKSAEAVPAAIEITRGDTVAVELILQDAQGERVTGAITQVVSLNRLASARALGDTLRDMHLVWGVTPGEGELQIWVLAASETRGFDRRTVGKIPIKVKEWPAERVELDPPLYAPYAGSTFPLKGRVITIRGTEHATAEIAWSSDHPRRVSVSSEGLASFRAPGRAVVRAAAEGLSAALEVNVLPNLVRAVSIRPERIEARTGDVVRFEVEVLDARARKVPNAYVAYSVTGLGENRGGAELYPDGGFVAKQPGTYLVTATAAGRSASAVVAASPRGVRRAVKLVSRGPVPHVTTSDLWVFTGRDGRDYAYTGTHAEGGGQRMYAWDVTDTSKPVLTDSVVVDARVVNDVKVNPEATVAVITREGASNRKNGIVVLDLADPAHPKIAAEFTDSLTAGVHNTWINGDVVYAVNDGTRAMHIIDISDPYHPTHVGRWEIRPGEEDKYLHDVWAKDGLAYLSYWDDGLVILDVGNGTKGGTPREPKFVSQYSYPIGNTHSAYRYGKYVFVSDEIFGCDECLNGPRGYVHILDVGDIEHPKEVGRYEVPEAGDHNLWIEGDKMYLAYYQAGLRIVDVSGELRGNLYEQGREIGWYHSAAKEGEGIHANEPMAWGPQLFKGFVFFSDMHSGLWVTQLEPLQKEPLVP